MTTKPNIASNSPIPEEHSADARLSSSHPSTLFNSRLVSIDPGAVQIGLAAFEGRKLVDYAVRVFPRTGPVRQRLLQLEETIARHLDEKKPQAIALEKTPFSTATQNGLMVLVYYRILAIARRRRIRVHEYAPITVRHLVCGNGHATKRDVMKIVISRFPELRVFSGANRRFKEKYHGHMFDAVAVGLAHLKRHSHDVKDER